MRFVGFIGPSYTLGTKNVDCQRCINMYPELDEIGSGKEKEIAALVSTPGLISIATIDSGPYRGVYRASNEALFVCVKNKLYRVATDYSKTLIATFPTISGPISMADNGLQLVASDGVNAFWNTLGTDTSTAFSGDAWLGGHVTYMDGRFSFNKPDSGQFYITELEGIALDGSISPTPTNADKLVRQIEYHRDLWNFYKLSTEVFFDSGNVDFPFERVQGAVINYGCAAAFSVAKSDNAVFWLSQNLEGQGMVFMAQGYQPMRISTHAIEIAIQSYSEISDARAYTYQQNGHHFYVLNFPTASTTWVFDTTTKLWHERAYTNEGDFERHRGDFHAYWNGKHILGDYANGNLYELSETAHTDNGVAITRQRVTPHMSQGLNWIFYSKFQLDMETGVGIDGTGQGDNPKVILEFSDDGGHSWSNEKWVECGKIGDRKARAIWRRLGKSRDRVFRVTVTDPIKVTMIGAELDVMAGAS